MMYRTPCRVREWAGFLEPTAKEREPVQLRGEHAPSLSRGSLKRMRGAHLEWQAQEETPPRHKGGGFFISRPSAVPSGSVAPQA